MLVRPVSVSTGEAKDPKEAPVPAPVSIQEMDPLFASGKAPVTFVTWMELGDMYAAMMNVPLFPA
jgi:hypothetical protein